ncbi:predicted protein [Coccidioides posadasii str. Silveira]|uniref:Predicted protein n=2 Tax=Coccidioides posadasii TaxID=199306 RepID=E9DDX3_COCPS|nr:predicted protein [Coccidioides posadasii str. Silveira]KMM70244.1 hypothetical protein CPAG_06556 [Coccidioides posadasii RMSCC 3488]
MSQIQNISTSKVKAQSDPEPEQQRKNIPPSFLEIIGTISAEPVLSTDDNPIPLDKMAMNQYAQQEKTKGNSIGAKNTYDDASRTKAAVLPSLLGFLLMQEGKEKAERSPMQLNCFEWFKLWTLLCGSSNIKTSNFEG